jgi:hypothetical protein
LPAGGSKAPQEIGDESVGEGIVRRGKWMPHIAARHFGWCILALVAALAGCDKPQAINEEDAAYCEAQGFPRGTDRNAQCAEQRADELAQSGIVHAPPTSVALAPAILPAPAHAGALPQEVPRTLPAVVMSTIDFAVSLNADCSADAPPAVKISKQPAHGTARLKERTDYPRFSLSPTPVACAGRQVRGVALEYTPAPDYVGPDLIEFEVASKNGKSDIFKVPITVKKPKIQGGRL